MKRQILVTLIIVCTSLTALSQTQLGYNLKVGDKFSIVQKADQLITQDMYGQSHEMTNVIEGEYNMEVLRLTDNGYIIGFSFERFKMEANSNLIGLIMDVDTNLEAAEDDMQSQIFKGLIGVQMEMEMLKTGKIVEITGTDELIDAMISGSGIEDGYVKDQMTDAMAAEFGGGTLAASFEQFTYIYPETKVRIGDTWENVFDGDLEADNTWTYASKENKQNTITGASTIAMNSSSDGMTMQLTGTQDTKVVCDAKTGFMVSFSSESLGEGDSVMDAMGDTKIPTKIVTKTTYSLK